jgi:hypothetical protein
MSTVNLGYDQIGFAVSSKTALQKIKDKMKEAAEKKAAEKKAAEKKAAAETKAAEKKAAEKTAAETKAAVAKAKAEAEKQKTITAETELIRQQKSKALNYIVPAAGLLLLFLLRKKRG